MLAQQTALALTSVRARRGRGPSGFSALRGFGAVDNNVAIVQAALNQAYSPTGTVLVVDGIWGSISSARMSEFQQFLGLPVNGNQNDQAALVALGLGSTVVGTAGKASDSPGAIQSIINALTLKGVRDQLPTSKQVVDAVTLQSLQDLAAQDSAAAIAAAQKALTLGGAAAAAGLKFLADNGNVIAWIALALGVSYGVAMAIAVSGGGLLLILLLKRK